MLLNFKGDRSHPGNQLILTILQHKYVIDGLWGKKL